MDALKLANGEWINDVHGLVGYDGEFKVIVEDEIDDCDSMFEILECQGKELIEKQLVIQKKAIEKFNKLDHSDLEKLSKNGESREWQKALEQKVLKFCKRNKTIIPVILYLDYIF